MAQILFGQQINLSGKATVGAKASRPSRVEVSMRSTASVSSLAFRKMSVIKGGLLNASASVSGGSNLKSYYTVYGKVSGSANVEGRVLGFKTISAKLEAGATVEAYHSDRDNLREMKDYLPHYYHEIKEAMAIIQAEANEVTRLRAWLSKVLDQAFVKSSDIALDRWETLLDIPYREGRTDEERRNLIIAKLRGPGATTLASLEQLVNSFYETSLTEKHLTSTVDIHITEVRGEPPNFADIDHAVNEVIPAHVFPNFIFSYVPWQEVEDSIMLFDDLNGYEWQPFQKSYPKAPVKWSSLENTVQADTDVLRFNDIDTRLEFD